MGSEINQLSGVEFENLCQRLLAKMGFFVESTKQSGDGGIDLIARFDQPMFAGTYIVQCKRYSGSVGEPIIRDLYGVVASEHANKGILITTGHFTVSAVKFAQGKNLELIDGEMLHELLAKFELIEADNARSGVQLFFQHHAFDSGKFNFYKGLMNEGKLEENMAFVFLSFLTGWFLHGNDNGGEGWEIVHAGLPEEFLRIYDKIVPKYYKGKKNQPFAQHCDLRDKSLALLCNFDLFEYVRLRFFALQYTPVMYIELNNGKVDFFGSDLSIEDRRAALVGMMSAGTMDVHIDKSEYSITKRFEFHTSSVESIRDSGIKEVSYTLNKEHFELMNLASLFDYFNIAEGSERVKALLYPGTTVPDDIARSVYPHTMLQGGFKLIVPSGITWMKRDYDFGRYYDYDIEWNVQPYFDRYSDLHREKIDREIERIKELLRSL